MSMTSIPGFAELEAAKALLLESLTRGVSEDEILPALQQLEGFRNSLWQADHLLVQAVQRCGLTEKHCVSSVEKLVAQALRISYGDAKRRVRAAAALGPRTSMVGEPVPAVRPALAAAQAAGEIGPFAVDLIDRTLTKVEILAPSIRWSGDRADPGRGMAGSSNPVSSARSVTGFWITSIRTDPGRGM